MESNEAPATAAVKKKARRKKAPAEPRACAYEKYEIVEINRQQIKNAPYNPRVISDTAKRKLKENIKTVGLLAPITWNQRTGNIVSGHQRMGILDTLEGTYNYTLKVCRVDLDEKTEKEQNIFMNNPEAQGDYEIESLEKLLKMDGLNVEGTGFDLADVYKMFGEQSMNNDAAAEMSEQLHSMRESFDKIKKTSIDKNNPHFYLVVIFGDYESRLAFTERLGLDDNRYVDGRRLLELLRPDGEKL
jgi:hypothetical protein